MLFSDVFNLRAVSDLFQLHSIRVCSIISASYVFTFFLRDSEAKLVFCFFRNWINFSCKSGGNNSALIIDSSLGVIVTNLSTKFSSSLIFPVQVYCLIKSITSSWKFFTFLFWFLIKYFITNNYLWLQFQLLPESGDNVFADPIGKTPPWEIAVHFFLEGSLIESI